MRRLTSSFVALVAAASMSGAIVAVASVAHAETAIPTITSDKGDYAPGEDVHLAGSGWLAQEDVHIAVDDSEGASWHYEVNAQADDAGTFGVDFTLPNWFVATYSVVATGASGAVATTTFTDSNVQVRGQVGGTALAVEVTWVSYSTSDCSGTAGSSGAITTPSNGNAYANTSGVGTPHSETLSVPNEVTSGSSIYRFTGWTGEAGTSSSLTFCVPGTADKGAIKVEANYVFDRPAVKQGQTISFNPPSPKTYGDADFVLSATTTSGLTVAFALLSGPCTLTGSTVAITGVGSCVLRASQAGDATYNAAPDVDGTIVINKAATTTAVTCPASVTYNGSALTPCTAAVTGPAGLNEAVAVSYLDNVAAGTATASAVYTTTANYLGSNDSEQFTIDKAPSTTTITCPTPMTYDGGAWELCTAAVTGAGGLSTTALVTYANNINVGTATAYATYAGDANHDGSSDTETFVIQQASSFTTVTCPGSVTYTGAPQTPCTAQVTGAGSLDETLSVSYLANTQTGIAEASASYPGDANHAASSDSKTFEITKATSIVTVTCPETAQYTGSAIGGCTAAATGAGGLNQPLTVTYSDNTNVGTATASASYAGDGNHEAASGSDTFSITTAPSNVVVTCPGSVTYNGSPQEPCTAKAERVGGSDVPLTPTYANNTNAGTATASATYDGDANHDGDTGSADFAIAKAESTVTVTCSNVVYDGTAQTPCTAVVTGPTGVIATPTVTYSDNTNAGTATAGASFAGDANHLADTGDATFVIQKADSTTTLNCPTSVTYTGEALEPCTAAVTGAGGLNVPLTVSYTTNTDAGTAGASAGYAGDANHEISGASTTFTIDPAPSVTLVTCPPSITYTGSALEPCTANVTGVGDLNQPLTVSYTNNTNAGPAGASASYAGDQNHLASSDSETFTIDKADSVTTVTCPASVTFNGAAHTPCSASVTGAGGLNLTPTPTYSNNTNAGTATASYAYAGDANHNGSSDSENFTIDKAESVTVLTCPASVTYNGAAQEPCSATVTGAGGLNGSVPVVYSNNTDAGSAGATATYAESANHLGSSDTGGFTIDKAPSTTTVSCPASVTYTGSAQEPCTASVSGAGGLGGSLTVTYADNTDAGTATASASFPEADNHLASSDSEQFTIGKAPLTVTADPQSRQYSDPSPTLTATISGFVGGQILATSGVTGAPTCTTTRTIEHQAGAYPITCGIGDLAASNYSFDFAAGTFTVTKEDAAIEYTGSSFFVGATTTATSLNAPVTAVIKESTDGDLGTRLNTAVLRFTATPNGGAATPAPCFGNVTYSPTAGIGSGGCTLSGMTVGESYEVLVTLEPNVYYVATNDMVIATTSTPGTGFVSGGGWISTQGTRSNLGFTVKNTKRGPQGSSLYIYRKTLSEDTLVNGVLVPAGSYNWIIKSNAMTQMTMGCATGTPKICTSSFTGKSNVKAVNRLTGVAYSLGGNQAFQIDVTDKGEPGASASTTPDTYALKVTNTAGTYYQLGTTTSQVALNGGNIQVRP